MRPETLSELRLTTVTALRSAAASIQNGRTPTFLNTSDQTRLFRGTHLHLVPEWFIQLSGYTRLAIEGGHGDGAQLKPGETLLIPPGIPHQEKLRHGATNLVGKIIDGRLCYHCSLGNQRWRPERLSGEVLTLATYHSTPGLIQDIAAENLELTYLSMAFAQLADEIERAPPPGGGSDLLARCQDQVEHRLHDPALSVAGLARELGCHPDHLSRLARTTWGMPLVRWISERRLLRARAMLATPSRTIAAIAAACGFSDARYFARVFSRVHNCTPSQWREHHLCRQRR